MSRGPKPNSAKIAPRPVYRPSQSTPASPARQMTVAQPLVQQKQAASLQLEPRPAPPVYRPIPAAQPPLQPKFRVENRPAPPVYRPQADANSPAQLKPASMKQPAAFAAALSANGISPTHAVKAPSPFSNSQPQAAVQRQVAAASATAPASVPPRSALLMNAAIQRMQTGGEVTPTASFGFQDYQGNSVTSHHHQTLEQFVTTYRVAESGHTGWDTQKQYTGHRNRCAACVGVYAEDQAGQSHIFSRDIIFDGCANLYSSGDGRETNALLRPEIREVSLTGGQSQFTTTRREFASPQLTQYTTNIGGYDIKMNVVDPLIVKANLMALNNWGMNKKRTGSGSVAYTAASHHHSEQVIVIALQGVDQDIAQWLLNLIQTNPNFTWFDYTILVHSEREMCTNCAKAFNGYIEHPVQNYPNIWAVIKKYFTYLPTATFQVSSRVDFNANRAPHATAVSAHGHQTFITPPSHQQASTVNYPGTQEMDAIYYG